MTRRAIILSIVGAIVLVGAVVGALWWAGSRSAGAGEIARDYVRALADGDTATIAALLDPALSQDDRELIGAAFDGASSRLTDATVTEEPAGPSPADAGEARFRVSGSLDGEAVDFVVSLREVDGDWVLGSDALGTVDLSTTLGDSVLVGDAVVPAGATPVELLPAVYSVGAFPGDLLDGDVVDGGATIAVLPGTTVSASVEAVLAPAAADRAQEALDDHLASCTASAASVPDGCGLRIPWGVEIAQADDFAYRVDRLPIVELSSDGRTFTASGGDYTVTVTGLDHDGAPASATYRDTDWGLRGSVSIEGDTLRLLAW